LNVVSEGQVVVTCCMRRLKDIKTFNYNMNPVSKAA